MQFRLFDSLGTVDARALNDNFHCNLDLKNAGALTKGSVVDLTEDAAAALAKKYPALLEPVERVRGVAKQSEVTAPAK